MPLGLLFPKAEATFLGEKAETANKEKLAQAKAMLEAGIPRKQIWDETGWFQGPERNWRYEIPDPPVDILGDLEGFAGQRIVDQKMQDVYPRPELNKAYPGNMNPRIFMTYEEHPLNTAGAYSPQRDTIIMGANSPDNVANTLLHELQHKIDIEEGYPMGSNLAQNRMSYEEHEAFDKELGRNPVLNDYFGDVFKREVTKHAEALGKDPKEYFTSLNNSQKGRIIEQIIEFMKYQMHPGEVMARNVEARKNFTDEQRRATPPWETYDVPESLLQAR